MLTIMAMITINNNNVIWNSLKTLNLFVITCFDTETNDLAQKKLFLSYNFKTKYLLKTKTTNQCSLTA